jgi:small GTP-binding protein
MELYTKKEIINDREVKIKIWDTAGQEQYRSLTRNFFHNTEGVFLIYDVTNKHSFEQVKTWVGCIHDNAEENVKVILIASKIDLEKERIISTEEGQTLAKDLKIDFFETSSKKNINIREAVLDLANKVLLTKRDLEEKIKLKQLSEKVEETGGCRC